MLDEMIREILVPSKINECIIIKTDAHFYSLRLGGFKHVAIKTKELLSYNKLIQPNHINNRVVKIYSDDHWCYIILANNFVISYGLGDISADGEINQSIYFKHKNEYEPNFFDEDFFELHVDRNGDSIFVR